MEFRDTEFDMTKSYRDFKTNLQKLLEGNFSNADRIRNLEDNKQLALMIWNMPKFDSIEKLYKWLCEEAGNEHRKDL